KGIVEAAILAERRDHRRVDRTAEGGRCEETWCKIEVQDARHRIGESDLERMVSRAGRNEPDHSLFGDGSVEDVAAAPRHHRPVPGEIDAHLDPGRSTMLPDNAAGVAPELRGQARPAATGGREQQSGGPVRSGRRIVMSKGHGSPAPDSPIARDGAWAA